MSRHVTHHDHILPYSNPTSPFSWTYHSKPKTINDTAIVPTNIEHPNSNPLVHSDIEPLPPAPHDVYSQQTITSEPIHEPNVNWRRSNRQVHKPIDLSDFICHPLSKSSNHDSSVFLI